MSSRLAPVGHSLPRLTGWLGSPPTWNRGLGVFSAVAQRVHEDAATYRTVGVGLARDCQARKFCTDEVLPAWPLARSPSMPSLSPPGGASHFHELATRELHLLHLIVSCRWRLQSPQASADSAAEEEAVTTFHMFYLATLSRDF